MEELKEKKVGFFKKIQINKKLQLLFFVVCMVVVVSSSVCAMQVIKLSKDRKFDVIQDNFSWVFQIDSIVENESKLVLEGWAFKLNKNATLGNFEIILRNIETEERYYPKMKYHARDDVNEYFLCEYDYTLSGFTAEINLSKLDLDEAAYEVILRPSGSKTAFATSVYYADGKEMFVNPNEFVPLQTEGTDLEKITHEGILRVYRPDYGMYVYQYEGELYWIAEEDYGFVDGDTCIQYQMDTTQVDKLPKDRLDNGWFWSNISFYFKTNELTEWIIYDYRVTKFALPKKYSVTRIYTGNYIDGWIWQQYFRPWYEFE